MMDKKDIISKLAGYKLEGDIEGREKTIELGYEIMIRLGMSRHSYFELFLSTFRFIHVHTWIIQLFIFLSGITMALNFKNLQPISEIMLCITGVIFISALFFIDELFKSFTTGMWELEQTFKYDLRQHIMMKLLIFGIIDIVIVILLSLMTKSIVSLPLYQILGVYILPLLLVQMIKTGVGNKILYLFPINNLNVQNILGILYSKDAFFFHSFFINIGFIFIFQLLIRVGMQLYCFIYIKHWKF